MQTQTLGHKLCLNLCFLLLKNHPMFGPKVETRLCLLQLGSSIHTVGPPLLALHSPSFPKVISPAAAHPLEH